MTLTLDSIAHNLLLDINGRDLEGSWTVDEGNSSSVNDEYDGSNILIPADNKGKDEWDSDNDDIVTLEADDEDTFLRKVDIVGFHPSKKVVFLAKNLFGIAAYHLDSSKFQYLGYARPKCYYLNYTNCIYESFVYTPCMIGDLLHRYGTSSR